MSVAKNLIEGRNFARGRVYLRQAHRGDGRDMRFLLRKCGKSIADQRHALKSSPNLPLTSLWGFVYCRAPRREGTPGEKEMNTLAGFILDKGSYPWDVVS